MFTFSEEEKSLSPWNECSFRENDIEEDLPGHILRVLHGAGDQGGGVPTRGNIIPTLHWELVVLSYKFAQ